MIYWYLIRISRFAFRTSRRARSLAWLGLALVAPASIQASDDAPLFDWGFWASRRVDPDGNLRHKVAGPFYERMTTADGRTFTALRPFYSNLSDPGKARELKEIMWPVASTKTVENAYSWRVLVAMGTDFDAEQPGSRYRTWLLPFYFQGRTKDGEMYYGLFPIFGSADEFLGRDEANWALFPLYFHSRINEVESTSWLWPVYSRTWGDDTDKFRVFPFYGYSEIGNLRRTFILWPLWNTGSWPGGSGFMLFPLYGQLQGKNIAMHWYLPPLFKTSRGGVTETTHAPWPLYQKSTGDTGKLYFWPLVGSKTIAGTERGFVLWPVFWKTVTRRSDEVTTRHFAVPVWKHSRRVDLEGVEQARYWKLWPLCSYRKDGEARRFRAFDLWPGWERGPIQRNYASLWTVWSHYDTGAHADSELLWGLYRKSTGDGLSATTVFPLYDGERSPSGSSWTLLKGLLARKKGLSGTSWRFLYFLNVGVANPERELTSDK